MKPDNMLEKYYEEKRVSQNDRVTRTLSMALAQSKYDNITKLEYEKNKDKEVLIFYTKDGIKEIDIAGKDGKNILQIFASMIYEGA